MNSKRGCEFLTTVNGSPTVKITVCDGHGFYMSSKKELSDFEGGVQNTSICFHYLIALRTVLLSLPKLNIAFEY